MKNSKKGFTLVELIIVVAVIALLAAVLIPTFSSLISKANQAKDEALVSNLNKAVALSTEKYDTVYDVLGAVKENAGFDVAKISASVSEHEILWDSVNYCFVYKTEKGITGIPDTQTNKNVKDYQYWRFVKNYDDIATSTYSVYWVGSALDTKKAVNVHVGFDAGDVSVATVNYNHTVEEEKDAYDKVILRTNGGTLNINAEKDSVEHYNTADKVIVTAVAPNSYHENGDVVALVVESGRVVVNEGATINTIIAKTTSTEIIVPQGADTIVYAPEGAKVEGVEKKGTPEVVESNIDGVVNGAKYFAGGSGVEADPYLIDNVEQIFELKTDKKTGIKHLENTAGYYKLIQDLTVNSEIYLNGKKWDIDLNGHTLALVYSTTSSVNNGSTFYIVGGTLTIKDSSIESTGTVKGAPAVHPNRPSYPYSAVRIGAKGNLNIYSGNFIAPLKDQPCIFTYNNYATVNIYGGKFEVGTDANSGVSFVLNHQDGDKWKSTAASRMYVYGGSFKNYNPGVTPVDPENAYTGKILLGEGCKTTSKVIGSDTWYTVSK